MSDTGDTVTQEELLALWGRGVQEELQVANKRIAALERELAEARAVSEKRQTINAQLVEALEEARKAIRVDRPRLRFVDENTDIHKCWSYLPTWKREVKRKVRARFAKRRERIATTVALIDAALAAAKEQSNV
jgi:predicted  nucleic acid-binding Zn-ribbon protein